jgi:hypothetical protein
MLSQKTLKVCLMLLCLGLWWPASSHAQTQTPQRVIVIYPAAEPQADSLALNVFFTVTDENGQPIADPGLETVEIQLLDGNTTPVPAGFAKAATPFFIGLLIDASGSMANVMDSVHEAAQSAIDSVPPNARVAVLKFNDLSIDDPLIPIEPFTDDMVLVKGSINAVKSDANAPTCLYNALYKTIELLDTTTTAPQERQAIILFTDGKDERADGSPCSQRTYDDVINRATRAQPITPIHPIGLCADAGCGNIKREELRSMGKETSAFTAIGGKESLGQLFGQIMNGLNSQLVAKANVFPRQGDNQAVLRVKVRDSDQLLTTTFGFVSDKDYAPPPAPVTAQISSIIYDAAKDTYQLAVSLTGPELIQKVVVEIWDEKGGTQVPPAQEFESPGETLQFERNSTGLVSGREYSFRVRAVDKAGNLIPTAEGETTLTQKIFVYEPPQVESIPFTIKSVQADYKSNELRLDLDVPDADKVNSYEGFIIDEDTGAGVHEFTPTLFPGPQIVAPLPPAMAPAPTARSYRLTLRLTDLAGHRWQAEPYEFKAIPPPPPGLLTRILTALQIPFVLMTIFVIILSVVLLVIYWNRPARKEALLSPLPRPPVDQTMLTSPQSRAQMAAQMRQAAPSTPVVAPPPPPPGLRLEVIDAETPPPEKMKVLTRFPCTLGRSGCDFNFPQDQHISRRHLEITRQGNVFYIADLESSNGTFMGEVRLPPRRPTPLTGPTLVRLGRRTQIRIEPQ